MATRIHGVDIYMEAAPTHIKAQIAKCQNTFGKLGLPYMQIFNQWRGGCGSHSWQEDDGDHGEEDEDDPEN